MKFLDQLLLMKFNFGIGINTTMFNFSDEKFCSQMYCYEVLQKENQYRLCEKCREKWRLRLIKGAPSSDPIDLFFWKRNTNLAGHSRDKIVAEAEKISDEMIQLYKKDSEKWETAHLYIGVGSVQEGAMITSRKYRRSNYEHFLQGSPSSFLPALAVAEIMTYYKLLKLRGSSVNMWNLRCRLGLFPIYNESGIDLIKL